MEFITTITQKGQVTIPKKIRDKVGIKAKDKVKVNLAEDTVTVKKAQTLLDIAPLFIAPKGKNALKAREYMENNYKRI